MAKKILSIFLFILLAKVSIGLSSKDSLINLLEQNPTDSVRIEILYKLSLKQSSIEFDQRLFYLHEALSIAKENKLHQKQAKINHLLGITYIENSDSNRIFHYFNLAKQYYKKAGTNNELAILHLDYSYAYDELSYFNEAIYHGKKALKLAGEARTKAHIYSMLATSYINKGKYEIALKALYQGLKLAEEANSLKIKSQININIGIIYYRLNDFNKALRYFTSASEVKRQINDKSGLIRAYTNIASILFIQGKSEEAVRIYDKALKLAKDIGDKTTIPTILCNIGAIESHNENHENAINYFKEAIEVASINDRAIIYSNLGKEYFNIGNKTDALKNYMLAFRIAQKTKELELVKSVSYKLSNFYKANNNYKKALEFQDIYIKSKDSLLNVQILKRISDMQNKHEIEIRENKILMLQKDNELKESHLAENNILIISLSIGSVLFVLSIVLLVLRYRYIQKTSSLLLFQKEKIHQQEKNILEANKKKLEHQLGAKNHELTNHIMHVTEKNEFISRITTKLLALKKNLKKENQVELVNLISELKRNTKEDIWDEFDIRFNEIQKDFYDKLNQKFPDLTTAERRLCAFLRMNMTSKEISRITYKSAGGIDTARSRLRKKLNISDPNTNITTFLTNL